MADIVYPGKAAGGNVGADLLPENVDLTIYKGDFVDIYINIVAGVTNVVLTGYTPKCVLRKSYTDETAVAFTCTLLNSTTAKIYMPSSISKTLDVGSYIWDFQLTDANGDTRTYFAGDVTVIDEVTK